jgi:hypothetical protein
MEDPLQRLLISSRSVNKHGCRSFGKAVSEEIFIRKQPIRNKNCLWRPCLLMYRNEMSNPQTWLPETILVSDWLISKKPSPLTPHSQMKRNLVGSTYGRFCIKLPRSRMKGERQAQFLLETNFVAFRLFAILLK